MSDVDTTETRKRGAQPGAKPPPPWTEHEVVVYLLSAIEFSGVKIDFANAPAPVGRNAGGCSQKITRVKTALRAEMDAIKNGEPLDATVPAAEVTPKKTTTPRKRKAQVEAEAPDSEGTPKKRARGRPKKNVETEAKAEVEVEFKSEATVKDEPDIEELVAEEEI